jgi:Tol biopolymer transport system component
VRITPGGKVKVLDFGLAKAAGPESAEGSTTDSVLATEAGRLLGTPTYMAPEQARGKLIDRRVDVWAFGCVLYECLTGERAFQGATLSDVLAAVLEHEVDLQRLPANTPRHVRELLARCLAKDPRERLRDIGDAGLLLAGSTMKVDADSLPARKNRWWIAAALVGVAAFAAGRLWPTPEVAYEPPRITQLTFSGEDRQPSVSPDGRLIAFTSGRTGVSQIWLRQTLGSVEQPLTEGPDWHPRFSADGGSVTFIRSQGEIYSAFRIPIVGGQPRKLIDDVTEIALSPSGRSLAFLRGAASGDTVLGSQVGVMDTDTGEERILLSTSGWDLVALNWSPDGKHLSLTKSAVQGGSGNWRTLLLDPQSGASEELDIVDSRGLVSGVSWAGNQNLVLALSPSSVSGTTEPSRIVSYDLRTRSKRLLLWAPNLFPFRGSLNPTTRLGVIDDHSLVFDSFQEIQVLYRVELGGDKTVARELLQGVAIDRQPAYHPDGSRVLFTSNRSGNVDLFSYEFASGKVAQLTDHPASDWDGAFTPDGKSLLWGSDRGGGLEIWTSRLDGTGARQLTQSGSAAENPTMTPDGTWVVYSSGRAESPGIYKVRSDGTEVTLLVPGNWIQPEVSPDGRHAIFVGADNARLQNRIGVVDLDSAKITSFAGEISYGLRSGNVTYGRGRWMPDGSAVAYLGLDEQGRTGLWVQDFDAKRDTRDTRRPLTGFDGAHMYESFGISPDARHVIFSTVEQVSSINLADKLPALR